MSDYDADYNRIARALKENNMYIEENSGLAINYGDTELGMSEKMLKAMILQNVQILTASDAHIPQNVGKLIYEMNDLISKAEKEYGG